MGMVVEIAPSLTQLQIAVVEVTNVLVTPANSELRAYCDRVAVEAIARAETPDYLNQCQEIRQLLKFGKFKATGRSKPAQEYLMRTVIRDARLPIINGPVDLLNAVSLEYNLPISLLSVAKCSENLRIDRGAAGQKFVFNSSGQELDLTDLIVVLDASTNPPRPVGSPIKDSMAGKIEPSDQHLVAIIYSPIGNEARKRCDQAQQRLQEGFKGFGHSCI